MSATFLSAFAFVCMLTGLLWAAWRFARARWAFVHGDWDAWWREFWYACAGLGLMILGLAGL